MHPIETCKIQLLTPTHSEVTAFWKLVQPPLWISVLNFLIGLTSGFANLYLVIFWGCRFQKSHAYDWNFTFLISFFVNILPEVVRYNWDNLAQFLKCNKLATRVGVRSWNFACLLAWDYGLIWRNYCKGGLNGSYVEWRTLFYDKE